MDRRKQPRVNGKYPPAEERFKANIKVNEETGCWEWQASRSNGYGQFMWDAKKGWAHIYSYLKYKGPIPDGYDVHHKCENPPCCNPDHLEAVTHAYNIWVSSKFAARRRKTHCAEGHRLAGKNLRWTRGSKGKLKACKKCQSARVLSWRERNPEKVKEYAKRTRERRRAANPLES